MASSKMAVTGAATVLLLLSSVALAQEGTSSQREACTPDAFRLCGQYIPDSGAITTCLRNSGSRLSPACYAVFYPQRAKIQNARRRHTPVRPHDDDDD